MSQNLFEFRENVYSQNGEDGIIEKLLSELKLYTGYYVEFGAHDGKLWSNTYRLYEKGWNGCLIEADDERYRKLCINVPEDKILKIKSTVAETGDASLDNILERNGVTRVDLLSIDIDSDDLRVWEGVKRYDPAIVVIEYNSTIPFDTRFTNPTGTTHGNSALSIKESANDRGYALVEGTDTNLIFAKADLIAATEIHEKSLQEIRDQTYQLRYFFGQDGTLLHDFKLLNDASMTELYPIPWVMTFGRQPIPRLLRRMRYGVNYPAFVYFAVTSLVLSPIQFFRLAGVSLRTLAKGRSTSELLRLLIDKERLVGILKQK